MAQELGIIKNRIVFLVNKEISQWILNPLKRFNKLQFSLIGEAFYLDRSTWIDATFKSSFISSSLQFSLNISCFENDPTVNRKFYNY
ncbi:unnamed protein product [Rotaria sp. Silwood2]|nr:unnamed protein product [Rotaria sp. Silwood2]CAF4431734.1 unnamed protein product [Rotaria sp. Silwood2]